MRRGQRGGAGVLQLRLHLHPRQRACKGGRGRHSVAAALEARTRHQRAPFLQPPVHETADILGLDAFLEHYDQLSEEGRRLSNHESFEQWSVSLPGGSKILCCPEDRDKDHRCRRHPGHVHDRQLCEGCEVPLCQKCQEKLEQGKLPPLSLANDMWTGYAPQRLVEQQVTVMEAICTCPCITTLICMTMEARYEDNIKQGAREAEPLNSKAQMARHRFGARGNALTFPLPLEELFRALQDHAVDVNEQQPLQLPRVGKELEHVVRVLLKTNKEGATNEQEIKTLIHQALVVVGLIMDMHRLGHPSYANLDEDLVRERAKALPEEGIPPEVLKVLPRLDGAQDKLQPQKAATPCDGRGPALEAGRTFAAQRGRPSSQKGSVVRMPMRSQLRPCRT
eukprot:s5512_g3.t1